MHMCVMTCSYVMLPVGIRCILTTGDMTHSHVCHDSFVCVPKLMHMCAMTYSYAMLPVGIRCILTTGDIHMCAMTYSSIPAHKNHVFDPASVFLSTH